MPSFKPKDLWDAEPHTLAKLEIVQRYLYLWFSILGRNRKTLAYIDGFAGPGKYRNTSQSSPLAALKAARTAMEKAGAAFKAGKIAFRFVDPKFAETLEAVVKETVWPAAFDIKISKAEFEPFMDDALKKLREKGPTDTPIFTFIDPFGPTPVPFRIIAELLSHPSAEVLLNLDSDGVDRLAGAANIPQNQEHLTRIFGDESWRIELDPTLSKSQRCSRVLALYKRRLRSIPAVRYIFRLRDELEAERAELSPRVCQPASARTREDEGGHEDGGPRRKFLLLGRLRRSASAFSGRQRSNFRRENARRAGGRTPALF